MKFRNKAIFLLVILGIILFGIVRGVIIPRTAGDEQQQVSNKVEPLTQDFESISKFKSNYMGNASNLGNLFYSLPLNDIEMSFRLFPDILTAEINYKAVALDIGEDKLDRALIYNSTAAFALIDNLQEIKFNFEGSSYKVLRSEVEQWYGIGPRVLAEKGIWEEKVQSKLSDDEYVQNCIKAIITQTEGRAPIAEALVRFYENTGEPIIIYEQIPFEKGTLVLAEKLTDGEHYPDLHFIDADNTVTYLTRGSYCWTLNYTQFRGHYIYFGLAGVETRQYKDNSTRIEKVEALFSDKIASVIPREEIITHINPKEKDSRMFKKPQGYMIPVESGNIPEDFIFVFENGERKSISKMYIERSMDNMPDYLKSKKAEVYNSYAFTFTPMLTPTEWDKGYKEDEICLEGKTDENGNRNALYLRPAGHMSLLDSFLVPLDIKPLYLSDNYPRSASFSAGETVTVKYPKKRELLDCRILGLTREKVEKEIGQDSLIVIETDEKGQIILPREIGYYLFMLRTEEDKEIQTYTGMLIIK